MILKAIAGPGQAGMRLDDAARVLFPELSKTRIRKIIDWGGCAVSQVMVRVASRFMQEGEEISIGLLETERCVEYSLGVEDVIFEDNEYLAVNKPAGLNSQRTSYQLKGTVEYPVGVYFKEKGIKEPVRVIHRLDKGTSGCMFFPKAARAATHISYLLKTGGVEKIYWALVSGLPEKDEWREDAPMANMNKFSYGVAVPGKEACTVFRVIARGAGVALIEARPLTGRTHQIRVHLTHVGFPVIGDATYGGDHAPRMMLHCRSMGFKGRSGKPLAGVAPVDADFIDVCKEYEIVVENLP